MTRPLFRDDPYAREADAVVVAVTDGGDGAGRGIVLDASLFYPTGGGQQGDSGALEWGDGTTPIATALKDGDRIVLRPHDRAPLPAVGATVRQSIDWVPRHRMMRLHTCLHLLSVVIPLPVTGGRITPEKGRLDFDMADPPGDRAALEEALNALIAQDHAITEAWITDAALAANPGLVKTLSVQPPTGSGRVRLVRIGPETTPVDLQPCGGTHVRSTAEIGRVTIGRIEKKGRRNRRVTVHLTDA